MKLVDLIIIIIILKAMIIVNLNINIIEHFNFKNINNVCSCITYFQILIKFNKIAYN